MGIQIALTPQAADLLQQLALDHLATEVVPRVVADAQRRAPFRTGRLRRSIGSRRTADSVIIEATADYAAYVELGTSKMAAQPFLRPALFKAV